MAMNIGGGRGGPTSDINMTPMIDVLLVLLIIFMVVQQGLQKGLSVQIPPIQTEAQLAQDVQIVLDIQSGNRYAVNQTPVPASQLQQFLTDTFAERNRKIIFIKGAEDISYGEVIFAVDVAGAAGIDVVGLVPRS